MTRQYVPVLVMMAMAGALVGSMLWLGHVLGPKSSSRVKGEAFECGNPPSGTAWGRFTVRFYMVAILFLLFDVEIVFLYPWAVAFRELGWFGFVEVFVFLALLGAGLVYVWRKGALEGY
ncbi:MAG: NADH-quinone oxidoreductase subunit A 1 [Candidatus Binatia bacterium]|nr:MAG: NADH-quinone oxidoreductase subunit A 1 [Candidatus Binatia bacterium]